MKLSVIIVNYNTRDLTVACLKSIERYPYRGEFEVIVVDNASTDGSVEKIRGTKFEISNLIIIENKKNVGFARGNNVGIRKAKGEYVLLLNSDAEVTKNALNELVGFAEERKDAGVVAPRLLNKDGTVQGSVFRLPTLWRAIRQYVFKEKEVLEKYAPKAKKPLEVESVVGAAFLITPKARRKVGLLDERYFMYFEDLDYCRKVRNVGLKVYYLPRAKVVHLHGASGKANPRQLERLIAASKVYHGTVRYYLLTAIIRLGRKAALFAPFGAALTRLSKFLPEFVSGKLKVEKGRQ